MATSADLLTALITLPRQQDRAEEGDPSKQALLSHPDSGLDGSCSCGCYEAPLTSEPPLADVAPLTSEPPIAAELPLTSEPTGAGFGTESTEI
ncbi:MULTISPECIES: hypothetical protein [unclassified Streptomyces]|uniref:hypothetical protein n=1 Tax=unclassified Streptomyces TaxID=2593676 RepID=UPI0022B6A9FC|nr:MULTISPECIES: hypothetical protein [unclassified Streptomyces]MCZ7414245.1 hypothetical protein [Streptomyces sp. WMMC897]MCZ7431263.1 hypothetical protein [Streptomyces sp. WMMC1477]